jgi:hypothetical protein
VNKEVAMDEDVPTEVAQADEETEVSEAPGILGAPDNASDEIDAPAVKKKRRRRRSNGRKKPVEDEDVPDADPDKPD